MPCIPCVIGGHTPLPSACSNHPVQVINDTERMCRIAMGGQICALALTQQWRRGGRARTRTGTREMPSAESHNGAARRWLAFLSLRPAVLAAALVAVVNIAALAAAATARAPKWGGAGAAGPRSMWPGSRYHA